MQLTTSKHSGAEEVLEVSSAHSPNLGIPTHPEKGSFAEASTGISLEAGSSNLDSEDAPLTFRKVMVLIAMSFLWAASQIPLYFYGGIEPQILESIGGYDKYVWIALGNLLPLAIITPFVGPLADLFGRRNLGLLSFILTIAGNAVCATATSMDAFVAGSILMGVGAGVGELIALAVAGEIAPMKKRGTYIGSMMASIIPFCPAVVYAKLISYASSWRWVGLLIGLWCAVGLVLTFIFYHPPPRHSEFTRLELAKRVDYVGGLLSGAGLTLFLVGLVYAGSDYEWTDAIVLAPFIVGVIFIIMFGIWEACFAKHPMIPARLKRRPRALFIILFITFASGANFFAVLIYWATEYQTTYAANDPVSQGIGSLPTGFGIIAGSVIAAYLVSIMKGQIRLLMIISTVIMTAFNGAMACGTPDNLNVLWPIVSLACVGVGLVIVSNQVIAGIICPPDLIATITAITISIRVVGGAIAYAIYYNIFSRKFWSIVPAVIAPAAIAIGINSTEEINGIAELVQGGAFGLLSTLPGVADQTQTDMLVRAGKVALSQSYPQVYYVSIAFGVLSVIASCFLTGVEEDMKGGAAVVI